MNTFNMSGIKCKCCRVEINNIEYVPKILVCCGVTICSECLSEVINSTKKRCPICLKAIRRERVIDYPENKAIVENLCLVNKINNEDFLQRCKQDLSKTARNINVLKTPNQILLHSIEQEIRYIEFDLDLLESLMGTPYNFENMFKQKLTLHHEIYKIRRREMPRTSAVVENAMLHSSSCKSELAFLVKVELLTDNKKLVAVLFVKGVKSRAKIASKNRLLLIHSFQKHDGSKKYYSLCFKDLQFLLLRSGNATAIYGFLVIKYKEGAPTKTIMIKIYETNSFLGTQFLKICSGELGFSYKDQPFVHEETLAFKHFIKVRNINWNMIELDCYEKYFVDKTSFSVQCDLDTSYLRFEHDGSFDIFKCKEKTLKCDRVVGAVVDFDGDIESICGDSAVCKISDCGIAYDF